MTSRLRSLAALLRQTVAEFLADNALQLAAALSFCTALSFPPTLILLLTVLGWAYDSELARAQLVGQVGAQMGPQAGELAQAILAASAAGRGDRGTAALVGFLTLVLGATAVMAQLQDALNTIWNVQAVPGLGVGAWLRKRLVSLALMLGIAVVLLVSLAIELLLALLAQRGRLPGPDWLWAQANAGLGLVVLLVVFAALFRWLPDVELQWRHVVLGAGVTAVLFTLGKWLIAFYLAWGGIASAYGAAGSLVVLLVWVYYSSLILFFGAELTQVYTRRREAVAVEGHAVAKGAASAPLGEGSPPAPRAPAPAPAAPPGRPRTG